MRTLSFKAALASLVLSISVPFIAPANAYEIYDSGAFLNSSTLGANSLGYLDGVLDDFAGSGVDLSFVSSLDSNGYGDLTWQFTNNTSGVLSDVSLFGYVDGEIDEPINSYFNEYGQYISVTGTGSGDIYADSWEIDEPGVVFGDIYNNLFLGALDNTNAVPQGSEEDVSLALGFELGDILAGQTWTMTLSISDIDIGGLYHGDDHSGTGAYINGTVIVDTATTVPEPAGLLLFLASLLGMTLVRRQRSL